jgi:hypothetical protein
MFIGQGEHYGGALMADNACFIFFRSGCCTLDDAGKALTERGLSVKRNRDELDVCFPGTPMLRVVLATGDYVREEAAEIAADTPHFAPMSACDARFEILIEDLDAVLDEINTLIDVQACLQDLVHGWLFRTWNGELSGPDWPPPDAATRSGKTTRDP